MKKIVTLFLFVVFVTTLFVSCDGNRYGELNTGTGVFYYGGDNVNGNFYGFIKGDRYYFEKHEDYEVKRIFDHFVDGKDVYLLCGEIHGTDTCSVIRKNGKIIDKFQWRNGGILLVHNGKVRVYGKYQSNTNIYEYKPNYWENGNFYDVELESPTLLAMTLFAQPQKFYIKNGDVYCLGFLCTVNGNTACVWKNNKLIANFDPAKNSLKSAAGFVIDKNDDVIMFKDIDGYYYEPTDYTYPSIAASFKNGELLHTYCDTAMMRYDKVYYRSWCGGATQVNNDIYFAVLQFPSGGGVRENKVILYKNFQEVCRLDSYQFKGICVKNNNIYTAQRFISVADGNCYLSIYENDNLVNSFVVPENMEVNIDGMFALP